MEITKELLEKLITCDFENGKIYWKERPVEFFAHCKRPKSIMTTWNKKNAGKEAFSSMHSNRYFYGPLFKKQYKAHRILWLMKTGEWPDQIDHINGNRLDNRWVNLRNVDHAGNCRNHGIRTDNKTGVNGVCKTADGKRYRVNIRNNGKQIHIGHYSNLEDAKFARKLADQKYGYHENHGREQHVG